jgi:carbon storage regulator
MDPAPPASSEAPGLVLTRKTGQRIMVGDDIVITMLSAGDGKARIGVRAPGDVRVDREEVRRARAARGASA